MTPEVAELLAANDRDAGLADPKHQAVVLVCECGQDRCREVIVVTLVEHARARDRGARLVALDHVSGSGSELLGCTERFAIVAE